MDLTRLADRARELGCIPRERVRLAELTTFKVGGETPLLLEVPSAAAADTAALCREMGVDTLWIGRGSNLLVSDKGLACVVLRLQSEEARIDGCRVTVSAGTPLLSLCRTARDSGLAGLEFAFGIPGTVGGGVYMNAGAYGGELKDVVESVSVLTAAGTVEMRTAAQLSFSYRHSALMDGGDVVLSATLRLTPDDKDAIGARMEEYMARRRAKQPLEYPSAGSFFKRPEGHFAGALIENCRLKGFRIGDAQVSDKHAGFVVNRGAATCHEICMLADEVRTRVREETGVTLEPEVRLLGEHWPWET